MRFGEAWVKRHHFDKIKRKGRHGAASKHR